MLRNYFTEAGTEAQVHTAGSGKTFQSCSPLYTSSSLVHWVKIKKRLKSRYGGVSAELWELKRSIFSVTHLSPWESPLTPCPSYRRESNAGTAKIGNATCLEHWLWQMDYRTLMCSSMLFQPCSGTAWRCRVDLGRLHVYQSSGVYLFLQRFQILLNEAQKMN